MKSVTDHTPEPAHRYVRLDTLQDDDDAMGCGRATSVCESSFDGEDDPFENPEDEMLGGQYRHPSGNPYSKIVPPESNSDEKLSQRPRPAVKLLSKQRFKVITAAILRQYSPTTGRRRTLRPEFEKFINSNSEKSATARFQIVEEMKRFDVEESGFSPLVFNRELDKDLQKELARLTQRHG